MNPGPEVSHEAVAEHSTLSGLNGNPEPEMIWYQSRPGYHLLDFNELWRYRQLIWVLTKRDLMVRYRQAFVGIAWAILQPLTMLLIFTMIFRLLGKEPTASGIPYPLVFFCGLLPWQLLANSLAHSSQSLVANQHLITKVYFPRVALPLASILAALADFLIASTILIAMMLWYGIMPSAHFWVSPLFVMLTLLATFAASLWLSAANGLYRDVSFIVPFLIQVGFFVSPVIFETDTLIPERWHLLFRLNPMVGVIEGFRWAVLGYRPPPWEAIGISVVVLIILTMGGMLYFRYVERFVADKI